MDAIKRATASQPATTRAKHSANVTTSQLVAPIKLYKNNSASLVIFDKDGTLISFDEIWIPWAQIVAKRIVADTGLKIEDKVYEVLGLCTAENRVKPGLLAQGTTAQIRNAIARLLTAHGIQPSDALNHVQKAITEADSNHAEVKATADLHRLFEELRRNGVKIAVCTSDSRRGTLSTLRTLQVDRFVDVVVCGDDAGAVPKPHPHNALSICRELDVDPQAAMVVGDTLADIGMGRMANVGCTVGVLSGVCGTDQLIPHAHHIVSDVGKLMPIVFDMRQNRRIEAVAR